MLKVQIFPSTNIKNILVITTKDQNAEKRKSKLIKQRIKKNKSKLCYFYLLSLSVFIHTVDLFFLVASAFFTRVQSLNYRIGIQ